jgi:hypothetical protein
MRFFDGFCIAFEKHHFAGGICVISSVIQPAHDDWLVPEPEPDLRVH